MFPSARRRLFRPFSDASPRPFAVSDAQEKTFDPTPRRLEKAREEGNVFRAQEAVSVGVLATAVALLFVGGGLAFGVLQDLSARLFLRSAQAPLTMQSVAPLMAEIGLTLSGIMVPFLVVMALSSMGLFVVQSGWNVTLTPLKPKFSRASPLKGLKRIFSAKGAFGTLKALVKLGAVGPAAYLVIERALPEIVALHALPLPVILQRAAQWILVLLLQMLAVLLVLAAIDFAFEKWKYKEDLKMSKKEVEDEQKETEGDPHVKGKRREKAREMAQRPRLDHAVMKSDVVVTNPTHYAIALRYDPEEAPAPRVLVKGVRKRALRIKELAAELDIPTIENRPLAHTLYDNVPEAHEIPEDLYPAVAAILAEVYSERTGGY
jgi:flagellar biosynthetic protein FlhB